MVYTKISIEYGRKEQTKTGGEVSVSSSAEASLCPNEDPQRVFEALRALVTENVRAKMLEAMGRAKPSEVKPSEVAGEELQK